MTLGQSLMKIRNRVIDEKNLEKWSFKTTVITQFDKKDGIKSKKHPETS